MTSLFIPLGHDGGKKQDVFLYSFISIFLSLAGERGISERAESSWHDSLAANGSSRLAIPLSKGVSLLVYVPRSMSFLMPFMRVSFSDNSRSTYTLLLRLSLVLLIQRTIHIWQSACLMIFVFPTVIRQSLSCLG